MFLFFGGLQLQSDLKTGIIIFSKVPKIGLVKTRLRHRLLTEKFKVDLHCAMIKDTICALQKIPTNFIPIFTFFPDTEKELLKKLILHPLSQINPNFIEKFHIVEQIGSDTATRFTNAFKFAFNELGLGSAIIIGSDTPHLQPSVINESIQFLMKDRKRAVLGPSQNGGFYLLGHNKPFISKIGMIFRRKSSYLELGNAMDLLVKENYKVRILPEVTDIDTFDDLKTIRIILKILSYTSSLPVDYYFPQYTSKMMKLLNDDIWI